MTDFSQTLWHVIDLAVAYVLALPLGWDREQSERSAGLRTFPLVAIASCGFMIATERIAEGSPDARARVIEGIIAGMGFIGGGAILKNGHSVRGTATAASLWATGAVGVASGAESYDVAVLLSVTTFLTLRLLRPFKQEPPDATLAGVSKSGISSDDENLSH